jgi:DNA polymerase III subunit epsilon
VVDVEATGLRIGSDEIISYGAVPIEHGRIRASGACYGLVRPTRPLTAESIRIHGIMPADLDQAPPLPGAIEPLIAAMTGRVVIAHAAWVERAFLGRALRAHGVRLRRPVLDTSLLGPLWLFERDGNLLPPMRLASLARALGVPPAREHHALGDALTAAQVFLAAVTHLDAARRETLGTLAGAERRLREIRRLHPYHAAPPSDDHDAAYPSQGRDAGAVERGGLENR